MTSFSRVLSISLKQRPASARFVLSVQNFSVSSRVYSDEPDESGAKKQKAKKNLSELLSKLKTSGAVPRSSPDREINLAKPLPTEGLKGLERDKFTGKPVNDTIDVSKLEPELVQATKEVVNILKDPVKKRATESSLLNKLKNISKETTKAKLDDKLAGEPESPVVMSSILGNLKIDKSDPVETKPLDKPPYNPQEEFKSRQEQIDRRKELTLEQVAFLEKRKRMRREKRRVPEEHKPVDLFGAEPLGIFTKPIVEELKDAVEGEETVTEEEAEEGKEAVALKTWRACTERELRILSTPSPRNALEEMILWTEQGKLWKFPIDNEQGLDYSDDPFHKHVFLEHHLDPWCPKRGPVRHFMELVCVGLSKNAYMTSQKKVETIVWFKEYFERPESIEILEDLGAWELESTN